MLMKMYNLMYRVVLKLIKKKTNYLIYTPFMLNKFYNGLGNLHLKHVLFIRVKLIYF